jgi:hypothetical protein
MPPHSPRPSILAPRARSHAAAAFAVAGAIACAASSAAAPAAQVTVDPRVVESSVTGLWRDHPSPEAPADASRYELLLRLGADHAFTLYPPCAARQEAMDSPAVPADPVARGLWRVTEDGGLHLSGEHDGRHVELDVALRLQDGQLEVVTPYGPGRLDRVPGQLPPACTTAR